MAKQEQEATHTLENYDLARPTSPSMDSAVSTSSEFRLIVSPLAPPPSEVQTQLQIIEIDLAVPHDYPPLESPCNIWLPMHFTETKVYPIRDPGDPIYNICPSICRYSRSIENDWAESLSVEIIYGRVNSESSTDEIRYPRVIAVMLDKDDVGGWRSVAEPVFRMLRERLGDGEGAPPVRFYLETGGDELF